MNIQKSISYRDQLTLLSEWGKEERKLDIDDINKLNKTYPRINISHTGLPLSAVSALYYSDQSKTDSTIKLLHDAIKSNPYLGVGEFSLGQLFKKIKIKDSSLFYSRLAVEKLPNYLHVANYINGLQKFEEYKKADSVYNIYKTKFKNSGSYHRPYLFNKITELGPGNDSLIQLSEKIYQNFKDDNKFEDLVLEAKFGVENMAKGIVQYNKGNQQFEENNLSEALSSYKKAIEYIPEKWEYHENLGIIYFKMDSFYKAEIHFNKVINSLKKESEKSLFYSGVVKLTNSDSLNACRLLIRSSKLGHKGAKAIVERYCIN